MHYYYLVSSFPKLNYGQFDKVPVEELFEKIQKELQAPEDTLVAFFTRERDLENLYTKKRGSKLSRRFSHFSDFSRFEDSDLKGEWQDLLKEEASAFPVNSLLAELYYEGEQSDNAFIASWAALKQALRAGGAIIRLQTDMHKQKDDLLDYLDNHSSSILETLAQNARQSSLGLSHQFSFLNDIREQFQKRSAVDLARWEDEILWAFYQEWFSLNPFSTETVLAFLGQLFIAESWLRRDMESGKQIIESLLEGAQGE